MRWLLPLLIVGALVAPSNAIEGIPISTDPCQTVKEQQERIAATGQKVVIERQMDSDGIIIYRERNELFSWYDPEGWFFTASRFNEDGCLDYILTMNEADYISVFGVRS